MNSDHWWNVVKISKDQGERGLELLTCAVCRGVEGFEAKQSKIGPLCRQIDFSEASKRSEWHCELPLA